MTGKPVATSTAGSTPGPWREQLDGIVRALSGAMLFGMPLLFTMEMWWLGESLGRWKLLTFLCAGLAVSWTLAYVAGFEDEETGSLEEAAREAVTAMAVGIVFAAVVLLCMNRYSPGDPAEAIVGMILIQAIPLAIGASVANALFRGRGRLGEDDDQRGRKAPLWELVGDVGATVAGAVFIGFTVAPTEEIPMLASSLTVWHAIAAVGLTLVATYMIVFVSGFDPQHRGGQRPVGLFQRPFPETVLAYTVSFGVAATILFMFGQLDPGDPALSILTETIVLAVPAAVGGAAGRIAT